MNGGPDLLIEATQAFLGVDADGKAELTQDCAFRIENGRIAEIADAAASKRAYPDLKREGGNGMVAMPGLVNAHHHFGVTPLMQGVPFAPLELWLPWFRAMRRIPTRVDTLYSAIEMLESGTTSVQHIHGGLAGSPEAWQAEAEAILAAYGDIGMRTGFCFMVRDQNILAYRPDNDLMADMSPNLREWIEPQLAAANIPVAEQMDFARKLKSDWTIKAPEHVRINIAPANLHWCSDAALVALFDTARAIEGQVHMHLVETRRQALYARNRTGKSAVQHLHALGCLGGNVTFGHGNWIDPEDLELLSDCGCTMCHNASSGLRLGSGIAPVNRIREHGIPVGLGIDQSNLADNRDMLLEMKLVWALHRETGLFNSRPNAAQILQMATEHGAKTLGFEGQIGRLAPGYAADIVLLDRAVMERPRVNPKTPMSETIVHRAQASAVSDVFVGGEKVVADGRVTRIDREGVLSELDDVMSVPATDKEAHAFDMAGRLMTFLSQEQHESWGDDHQPYRYNAFAAPRTRK